MTRHLLPGEIIEAATRRLASAPAIEHLSTCAQCKAKIEDYRATRMALVPAGATQASEPGPDCPPLEQLARYSAGHKDPELAGHIAQCDRCAWIVRDALAEDTEPAIRRRSRTHSRIVMLWSALGLVVLALLGGLAYRTMSDARLAAPSSSAMKSDSSQDMTEIIAKAYTETRPFEYRLKDNGYSLVRPMAASDRSGYVASAMAAIERRRGANEKDPEVDAFEGRVTLLTGKYQEALTMLTRAANIWPDDPTPRRDLGCAYALRGALEDRASDFEEAARLFRGVLERQPKNPEALFNLALVEERLFHADEASVQWKKFLDTNPEPGWRHEAERHQTTLEKLVK